MAAAARRAEPRRADDVEAEVALAAHGRLAGVQAHPHPDVDPVGPVVLGVGALRLDRCRDGVAGTGKGEEEGIALRVDLDASEGREAFPHQPPVLGEDVVVTLAEPLQERGRAFDVAEDERDRAAREAGHASQYAGRMASSGA